MFASEQEDLADIVVDVDDDEEEDDFGDDDEMTNTGLLHMVAVLGDEEDEFSLTSEMVIPSDAVASSEALSVSELLEPSEEEATEGQRIVMTNAGSDTERVRIIQPLPQDEDAIDAVTIQMPDGDSTGRSIVIPLKPSEIEPDLSTEETAKNPSPYPDILDASFVPYDED